MATAAHLRVELDTQKRISLGKLLRSAKTSATSWDAAAQADGTIILRPLLQVSASAVSKLSPAAWEELHRLIEEDRGPAPALLRAATASRKALEAGRLVRKGQDAAVPKNAAKTATPSTGARVSTRRTVGTRIARSVTRKTGTVKKSR